MKHLEIAAISRLSKELATALPEVKVGDKVIINLGTARSPSYWSGVISKVSRDKKNILVDYHDGDQSKESVDDTGTGLVGFLKGSPSKTEIDPSKLASKLDSKRWIAKAVAKKLQVETPNKKAQEVKPPTKRKPLDAEEIENQGGRKTAFTSNSVKDDYYASILVQMRWSPQKLVQVYPEINDEPGRLKRIFDLALESDKYGYFKEAVKQNGWKV